MMQRGYFQAAAVVRTTAACIPAEWSSSAIINANNLHF